MLKFGGMVRRVAERKRHDMNDTSPSALALPDFDPSGLIDSLVDGIYITDTERRILLWNRAAERITGWSAEEVVGRTCFDNILCHVDKDGHNLCGEEHCPLHRSVVTGTASEEPLLLFAGHKSGQRIPVEVSVAPLRNRKGKIVGGIEMFRDASVGVHDMLRAKAIQELAFRFEGLDDPRFEVEVCHQAYDLVGGDFYRVEQLDDGRMAILVADVMGHGVSAALYTMYLASLWDQFSRKSDSPPKILHELNRRLHLVAAEAGFFATAVLGLYDPATGSMSVARAGHPAPLVFRRGGDVEAVGKPRPALGMVPEVDYLETRLQLELGESILFFTDGAIEVCDTEERELGIEGLQDLVLDQIAADPEGAFHLDPLEEQLLTFSNALQLPDDLTLFKLRRTR